MEGIIMMKFDPATLRARFHQAGVEKDALVAQLQPVRDLYEVLRNEMLALQAQIKIANGPIAELDRERAKISRALGGKTGAGHDSVTPVAPLEPMKPVEFVDVRAKSAAEAAEAKILAARAAVQNIDPENATLPDVAAALHNLGKALA
jgi:hypothetical protein